MKIRAIRRYVAPAYPTLAALTLASSAMGVPLKPTILKGKPAPPSSRPIEKPNVLLGEVAIPASVNAPKIATATASGNPSTPMVAVRDLVRSLGVAVKMDRRLHALTLSRGSASICLTPGRTAASVGGQAVHLPVAPYVRRGVTYVPAKSVASALEITLSRRGGNLALVTPDSRRMLILLSAPEKLPPTPGMPGGPVMKTPLPPISDKLLTPALGSPAPIAPPKANRKP